MKYRFMEKPTGANKYETSLICYALSNLWQQDQQITLYEMLEGNLKQLPVSSLSVIERMGIVDVVPTDMTLEKNIFDKTNSLRSPRYLYNLFNKFGNKHCALCKCEIPELIQWAHIWPVADIKRTIQLTQEQKLACAIDGDNGLWLCENHHKMFDEHLLTFNGNGNVVFKNDIDSRYMKFIDETTRFKTLPEFVLTEKFLEYLWRRNKAD
ncbi:MAG: HNH endonuclease [Christensenellaceae bacterium]